MGAISDAAGGLKTQLDTISSFKTVLEGSTDKITQHPSAVIALEEINYLVDIGSNSIVGFFSITVRAAASQALVGWQALEAYLDPTGTDSIKAAIVADPTLNGKVDTSQLVGAEDIVRDPDNAKLFMATLTVEWAKAVA